MALMELGICSKEVLDLQKDLNKIFGSGKPPADGTYDEKTRDWVNTFQTRMGLKSTGKVDSSTLLAIDNALIPRKKIIINGKEIYVTKEGLAELRAKARANAVKAVKPFVAMAKEAKGYRDFFKKQRDDNWFSGIIEFSAGVDFPSKALFDKAIKDAEGMVKDAKSGKLTVKDMDKRAKSIKTALQAIQKYRDKLHDGGDDLVGKVTLVRDGCVLTLEIYAALGTGGASWGVQVGAAAGMGAYKGVLKEVDKASSGKEVTIKSVAFGAFKSAAIEGSVGLIMKGGGKGLGGFADDVAEAAIKKVGTGTAKKKVAEYVIRGVNGGAQKVVEDGLKALPGVADPNKKITRDDVIKGVALSFVTGAGLKMISPVADDYAKKASAKITSEELFKGFGKIDHAKAYAEGGKKIIDAAGSKAMGDVLKDWTASKDPKKFEVEVKKKIMKDSKVKTWVKKAAKSHKK